MGNLYTQYVRVRSEKLEILSELKQAWHTTPKDFRLIKELQDKLERINKEERKKRTRKVYKGQYG